MDRYEFLKSAGLASLALLDTHVWPPTLSRRTIPVSRRMTSAAASGVPPNILVILVDQLRYPQWFPAQATLDTILPNLASLRSGAVTFRHHYTAASACTPSRACLLTGLYAHQTGCLLTMNTGVANQIGLNPGFPTWGTALSSLGYQTYWFGKWHLSTLCDLGPYGFSGGTCPSPNGSVPGEGLAKDPIIASQFISWLQAQGTSGPWCTTVSLVNPHDISAYPTYTNLVAAESQPYSFFTQLPPNFETDATLQQNKPSLQTAFLQEIASLMGVLPYTGQGYQTGWLNLLNLYLQVQYYVDMQIGRVLAALNAQPAVAANTIIVFTSDHGEFGGSHGLRNKGGAVYEESIRVPLYVKDPTGLFAASPQVERTQLTSSVDMAPLLLSLASGGSAWRTQPQFAHLANRLDLGAILQNPQAPGRPYVLHTTDQDLTEGPTHAPYNGVPNHVIGCRTATAKLGLYSYWTPGTLDMQQTGQEAELYDYTTQAGQLELANTVQAQPALYNGFYNGLTTSVIPKELRQPLPASLQPLQQAAFAAYTAAH